MFQKAEFENLAVNSKAVDHSDLNSSAKSQIIQELDKPESDQSNNEPSDKSVADTSNRELLSGEQTSSVIGQQPMDIEIDKPGKVVENVEKNINSLHKEASTNSDGQDTTSLKRSEMEKSSTQQPEQQSDVQMNLPSIKNIYASSSFRNSSNSNPHMAAAIDSPQLRKTASDTQSTSVNSVANVSHVRIKQEPETTGTYGGLTQTPVTTVHKAVTDKSPKLQSAILSVPKPSSVVLSAQQVQQQPLRVKVIKDVIVKSPGDHNQKLTPNNKSVRELLMEGHPVKYQPIKVPRIKDSTFTVVVTEPSQTVISNTLARCPPQPASSAKIIVKKSSPGQNDSAHPGGKNNVTKNKPLVINQKLTNGSKLVHILPSSSGGTVTLNPVMHQQTNSVDRVSSNSVSVNGQSSDQPPGSTDSRNSFSKSNAYKILGQSVPNYRAPTPPAEFLDATVEKKYNCTACGDSFLFESSLLDHFNRLSVQMTYSCEVCKKTVMFYNRCTLIHHLHIHSSNINGSNFSVKPIPQNLMPVFKSAKPTVATPGIVTSSPPQQSTSVSQSKSLIQLPVGISNSSDKSSAKAQDNDVIITGYQQKTERKGETLTSPVVLSPQNIKIKTKGNEIKCSECGIFLSCFSGLSKHFGSVRKSVQCNSCSMVLPNICSLRAHVRTHLNSTPFVCPECGQLFHKAGLEAFLNHLNNQCFHNSRVQIYKCLLCPRQTDISETRPLTAIRNHMQNSHGDIYFKCVFCPMAFKSLTSFKSHFQGSHEGKEKVKEGMNVSKSIYKCPICDTVFHHSWQLPSHIENHIKTSGTSLSSKFRCNLCPESFMCKTGLMSHLEECHAKENYTQFVCRVCGKALPNSGELDLHLVNEHPTAMEEEMVYRLSEVHRSYSCGLCHINFNNLADLEEHKKIHQQKTVKPATNQLPKLHVKKILPKSPVQTISVHNTNSLINNVESPMKISKKKQSSRSPSQDNTTQNVPLYIDDFKCSECNEGFDTEHKLVQHLKAAHDIVRQFPCHLCGFTYTSRHDLKVHVKVIHEGRKEDYVCWLCQEMNVHKAYTKRMMLEKHITGYHKIPKCAIDYTKMPKVEDSPAQENEEGTENDNKRQEAKRSLEDEIANAPVKRLKVSGDSCFFCSKCAFSTEDKQEFQTHIEGHKAEKDSLQCPECGMCFVVQPSLKKHLFIVHKIRNTAQYMTDSGIKAAADKEDFDDTEESCNSLECTVCYRSFETVALMRTHMRSHGMAFIRKSKRAQNAHSAAN